METPQKPVNTRTSLAQQVNSNSTNRSSTKRNSFNPKFGKQNTTSLPNLEQNFKNKFFPSNLEINKDTKTQDASQTFRAMNHVHTLSDYKYKIMCNFFMEAKVGYPISQIIFFKKKEYIIVGLVGGMVLFYDLKVLKGRGEVAGKKMVKLFHDIHYK